MTIKLTRLDARLEAALGDTLHAVYANEARAEAATARLIGAHRDLVAAEASAAFQRVRLHALADGQRRVDDALLDELDEALERLEEAAEQRDVIEGRLAELVIELELVSAQADAHAKQRAAVAASTCAHLHSTGGPAAGAAAPRTPASAGRRL